MLFGGSSWSEVPISSLGIQNVYDEFNFGFSIGTEFGSTGTIDQVLSNNKKVDTIVSFDGKLDTVDQFALSIYELRVFRLGIEDEYESPSGTLI